MSAGAQGKIVWMSNINKKYIYFHLVFVRKTDACLLNRPVTRQANKWKTPRSEIICQTASVTERENQQYAQMEMKSR